MKRNKTGLREKINFEELANLLLDDTCEMNGIAETCYMLLSAGYLKRELYYLGFDEEVIDDAQKRVEMEKSNNEKLS
jgi:hypothetical protein